MRANIKISRGIAGRVTITFPYDPAHVAKIKAIEGSRWHPKEKYWSAPRSDGILEKILRVFAGQQIAIDPLLKSSEFERQRKEVLSDTEKELKLRGYSQKTRRAYLRHINRYVCHFIKDPRQLDGGGYSEVYASSH